MNFLASQPFQSNHASHNLIGLLQYNIEFTKLRKKSRYLIIEIFSYKYNETNHYFFLPLACGMRHVDQHRGNPVHNNKRAK